MSKKCQRKSLYHQRGFQVWGNSLLPQTTVFWLAGSWMVLGQDRLLPAHRDQGDFSPNQPPVPSYPSCPTLHLGVICPNAGAPLTHYTPLPCFTATCYHPTCLHPFPNFQEKEEVLKKRYWKAPVGWTEKCKVLIQKVTARFTWPPPVVLIKAEKNTCPQVLQASQIKP